MSTAVKTRAATALSTMVAFFGAVQLRTDAELLLSKTPDQREDLGLSLADMRMIRG
ncbi:MAG: hypothetical protein AAGC57_05130 [Pseudomonadota bacterium]